MNTVTTNDREILRKLARRQRDVALSPEMDERVSSWKALNNFRMKRPMVVLELATFEQELIPQRLACENSTLRKIEAELWRNILPFELFEDDYAVPDYFPVPWSIRFELFGVTIKRAHADGSLGHRFEYIVDDLETDFPRLGESRWSVDRGETKANMELAGDIFGDILPPKLVMDAVYSVPTQQVVHMMGMENMLYAMMDCPDVFKALMNRIAEDTVAYFRWLESEGLLLPTASFERLGQGTWCFTDELPHGAVSSTREVWGFMDSQETVGISPEMYGEFVFPYYQRIAGEYGLLSYGCCEPVHAIWEPYLSKLGNLRKVSISPWCDEEYMGARLRGKRIVYQRKPSPNFLGVGSELDEDEIRKHIIKTLKAAKGCALEFTQRDVYTLNGNPEKARRYIAIIRQCIEDHWE